MTSKDFKKPIRRAQGLALGAVLIKRKLFPGCIKNIVIQSTLKPQSILSVKTH
jgi:hypothetical protein